MSWLSYSSLIPPNVFILLVTVGVIVAWRRKPAGLALATAASGCLYLVSMPVTAGLLVRWSEAIAEAEPQTPSKTIPGAIVVLAADARRGDTPGEPETVGPLTLERLAEAARAYRRLGLPILVSGGPSGGSDPPLATVMSRVLEDDFRISAQWREDRSRNTFENASFSAAILRQSGVSAALVVAHPWDMARALWSFRAVGYPVLPMPTPHKGEFPLSTSAFLPQIPALHDSYFALHELIGLVWYRLRYGDW